MNTRTDHRSSLTMYRLLVVTAIVFTLFLIAGLITLDWPPESPFWYTAAVFFGLCVPVLISLKRRGRFREEDEKTWPWWKASAFTVVSIAAVWAAIRLLLLL